MYTDGVLRFALGAILGCVMTFALVFLYEGWYEYRIVDPGPVLVKMINEQGWQLVDSDGPYIKRPRIRF